MTDINELIQAVERDKEEQLKGATYKASQGSPEQSGKVYDLAQRKGLPYDYVERHYDTVNRPQTDNLPPKTSEWLRDRRKAQISIDDIENLSWWETAAQEGKNLASLIPSAGFSLSQGVYATGASVLNAAGAFSLWMDKKLGLVPEEAEGNFLMSGGQGLQDIAINQRQAADAFFPTDSVIPDPVLGGVKSAVLNAPMLLGSVLTRNPAVALGGMGSVSFGESYIRGKESGLSETEALMLGINNGIAEVVTERIPLSKLVGDIGTNAGFWRTVANQMAAEIPTEQVATIWQDASDWAALNPDKTLKDFLAERPEAATNTLISTVVATGLQTSLIAGADHLIHREERRAVEQAATKAQESKVNTRSPETFAQHVQDVAEEYGSVENIYLDAAEARTLFQDLKQDPAKDLIAEQIEEAESVGGDIVIPIGEFTSKLASSENYSLLKEHLRLTPESPTKSDLQTDHTQSILELMKDANANIEARNRADEIFTEVQSQLVQSGRLDPQSAKVSAAIVPAYVTARATRSGKSVDEIYEMMGLKIVGPELDLATSQGVILDQAREQGYEGESMGEALEWRRAVEKFGPEGMTQEARLHRAQEMGFDTENIYYHESSRGEQIQEIHGGGKFGGIFSLENDRAGYYDNVQGFYLKGEPATNDDIRDFADENTNTASQVIEDIFGLQPSADEILEQAVTFENLPPDLDGDYYADLQKARAQIAEKAGFTAVIQEDEFGNSVQLLPGSGVRSISAAFDPDFADSPRLLAQSAQDVQSRLEAKINDDFDAAVREYNARPDAMGGRVLNTDIARELSEDYLADRTLSAAVHEPASDFIKKLYAEKLKQAPAKGEEAQVLFTAGGTGAGKTTAVNQYLNIEESQIVYDTNMNTYASAKKKVEQALEAGKNVQIAAVYRDPVDALVNGALPRAMRQAEKFGSGRTVPISEHIKTHQGFLEVIPRLAEEYADNPLVQITVFDNSHGKNNAKLADIDFLRTITHNNIVEELSSALEKAYEAAKISESVYQGFKGAQGEAAAEENRQRDAQGPEQPEVELFQGDQATPRGVISLLPKESIIQLTKASDLTTFLHESGHLFLEMEGRLFNHPDATDDIKRDGQIILDFLGAESFEKITTEQHEKFARGFESYLGEGKAPSVELQSVFRRFAAWIKQVYRSLSRLNVELTDDMRQVFDRMLATDDQIDRMKGRFKPLFESAEDAGVTAAEYRAYQNKATPEVAKEQLRAKLLKQLERQHKKWWRDESAVIAKGVREELLEQPVYQVVDTIRGGEFKLSREEVKSVLGVQKLPKKFNGLTSKEGRPLDEIAALYGTSGHDLVTQINEQPTLKQATDERTYEEMVRRHGDALTDGTLEQMAEQAAHDTEYGKKLASEITFLSRKTKQPAIDRQAVKEYAREKIAGMAYKKIYPNRYRANEVRSARAAAVAKSQGDNALALKHKQQELVNFYLAKEAQYAKDRSQKIRASLKAIQSRKYDSKKIDTEMVNEAKVLIAAFDFRKNNKESVELAKARIKSVRNWIESQQANPESVTTFVEAEILGKVIPYDEMSFEDLRGLDDVVKSIMFAAKKVVEADSEAYKREIAETAEYLQKNRIETYETEIDTDTPWVRAKSTIQELFASLRKMESLVRQADGMNEQGRLWKQVVKPLLDASNNALAMRTQAHHRLNEIFKGYESAFNGLTDRRQFTLDSGKKITMSYGARLSLALNMGNDSNLEALLSQGKITPDSQPYMTEADINRIVATLSKEDWDLVQGVWDYIDTYWPQISELEMKRSGAAPQKVKPREFVTPTGKVMKGGYYPLVGDPIEDSKQLDQDISAQAQQMMQGGAAKKSTKHGSTIERVGFGGKKIDLSINVLFNHVDGVIHDITHWEAVRDADRVLRHPKIQNELNTSLGKPGARAIKDRLTEVAAGPQRINGMRGWNRILRHARMAATFGALGYSVRTSITNMLGLTAAAMEMDARTVAGGAAEYYSNIKSNNELILSKSKYMRDRGEVLNRDIAFIRNNLKGDTRWNKIKDNAFWMMTQTDKAITRPIWMAAYRQGETMFDTEQEAIDHADRMVARTQGSGLNMDLSSVETRNELMKAMTVMFSAMNAIYNITTEQVKRRKAGKINSVQLATKLTWGIVIAGIAEEMIRGTWDEDEEETVPGKIAGSTANMALSLIPIGRDIASYAQYGSSFPTPIVQLGLAPVDVYKQSSQGEVDKAFVRSLTGLSAWALVPGGAQFNRTAGYLIDLNEGEIDEFSPWGLIVTGKGGD